MRTGERLPGAWVELQLFPLARSVGLGPAVGWLAGVLASGGTLWPWPEPGWLLLGILFLTAAWGRLWFLLGQSSTPLPYEEDPPLRLSLPYTVQGSMSAALSTFMLRAWRWVRRFVVVRQRWLLEVTFLILALLLLAGVRGFEPFLVAMLGVALLFLRRLVRHRPMAMDLLNILGGLAWPWWLGHTAWAPLEESSLLLSLLWGLAYAGWATPSASGAEQPLLWTDLAQGFVLLFFILTGEFMIAGILSFFLLAQVLLQAGLARTGRWETIPARTWPLAAAGLLLSGLVGGGWV